MLATMDQQINIPRVVGQDHLQTMPPEILLEIFKHALQAENQQVLPSPYMRVSKMVRQHVVDILTENRTLQLECHHPTSHHFWATLLYQSTSKGEFLRSSTGLPTIKNSVVRWSKFRSLFPSAEMVGKVDSVYIKLRWMRDLAFTILFHHNQPPTIKTHAWFRSSADTVSPPVLRPDMTRWIQQPAVCSVEWIEAFISDMRNQSLAYTTPHHTDNHRHLYATALEEMKHRQHQDHAVRLRPTDSRVGVPKRLETHEADSLRHAYARSLIPERRRLRRSSRRTT